MHFLAHTPGSASPSEGARPMQLEDAKGDNGSEQLEGARDNDESLLENLSPILEDVSPMASEEYEAYCRELDATEEADGESSPPK